MNVLEQNPITRVPKDNCWLGMNCAFLSIDILEAANACSQGPQRVSSLEFNVALNGILMKKNCNHGREGTVCRYYYNGANWG